MNRTILLLAALAVLLGGATVVQSLRAHSANAAGAGLRRELAAAKAALVAQQVKTGTSAAASDKDEWELDDIPPGDASDEPRDTKEGEVKPLMASLIDHAVQSMLSEPHGRGGVGDAAKGKKADKEAKKSGDSVPLTAEERKQRHEEKRAARGGGNGQAAKLVNQAAKLMKSGNYEEAQALLEQSLAADPANRQAWKTLASLQRQTGMADQELQTYADWMEAMPDDALARYLAAGAFARNGLDTEARQYLADFQNMSQGDLRVYPMAAQMYQQMGMRAEEGDALRQWVAAAPDAADARRLMGDYYRRMGDTNAALTEYQTMAALQPGSPSAYVQMGNLYRQTGQYAAAVGQYETALDLRPGNVTTLGRLADAQRLSGDLNAAAGTYNQVIALEPGSQAAVAAAASLRRIERQLNPPVPRPVAKP